jgi:hypothetical protein
MTKVRVRQPSLGARRGARPPDAVARDASEACSDSGGQLIGAFRNFKQNTKCRTKHLYIQMLFSRAK